ncbi:hypothetical protein LMG18096_01154 [Ralstonia holmesii]|uniref:Uncharacterized protein n=1 Tax=Ralstonia holmesii TaxID=3058602 RepID=A0ABC8Q8P3_9RALS|nr:hypothetical protein LMG18096_01154 [Ralstonia sp. LMG 32967]CAJ0811166.1 hypothetical protein LMG18093_01263 [Ralstonia sp. LMG 32967]CBJ44014.1 protein of unknown function [Ralstonia solanacearum CFBP2957]
MLLGNSFVDSTYAVDNVDQISRPAEICCTTWRRMQNNLPRK